MKTSRLQVASWFLPVWMALLAGWTASGIEPPTPAAPLLTGPAAAQVTTQTLVDARGLIHGLPGQAAAELWLCDCRHCLDIVHCNELGYIDAYLTPRLFTARLIRGQRVDLCRFPGPSADPGATPEPFNDWFCQQADLCEYAVVAAAGQTFTPDGPLGHPIFLRLEGEVSDEDVVTLAQALQKMVPTQQMSALELIGPDRVHVRGWVRRRGLDCFELTFHKIAGQWQPTTRKPRFLTD